MKTENHMTTLADLEIGNPKTVLNLTAVPLSGNPALHARLPADR